MVVIVAVGDVDVVAVGTVAVVAVLRAAARLILVEADTFDIIVKGAGDLSRVNLWF